MTTQAEATGAATAGRRCSYCGETDAWPRELCIERLVEAHGPNPGPHPCSYSVEGIERTHIALEAALRSAEGARDDAQ